MVRPQFKRVWFRDLMGAFEEAAKFSTDIETEWSRRYVGTDSFSQGGSMPAYFEPLRRAIGTVRLVMTSVFAAGWVRTGWLSLLRKLGAAGQGAQENGFPTCVIPLAEDGSSALLQLLIAHLNESLRTLVGAFAKQSQLFSDSMAFGPQLAKQAGPPRVFGRHSIPLN